MPKYLCNANDNCDLRDECLRFRGIPANPQSYKAPAAGDPCPDFLEIAEGDAVRYVAPQKAKRSKPAKD